MMNSLVATSLVLLLSIGFGCSQVQNSTEFNFTAECVKIMMRFEIDVNYTMTDGSGGRAVIPGANFSDEINDPCNEGDAFSLNIPWENGEFSLTLNFAANMGKSWNISSVMFQYSTSNRYFDNPSVEDGTMDSTIEDIANNWNRSYSCASNPVVNLMNVDPDDDTNATFKIQSIEVQAFSFPEPGNFTDVRDCRSSSGGGSSDDDDDKIVPIAVGCALAGLVIIVLIAYLIGRFKNRKTDTYQVLS